MNSRLVVFKVLGISRKQLGFGSWKACLGCDYTLNHFALCPLRWFYSLNNYHSTNKHFNIHNWTIWVWTCLDLNLTLEASVVWRFLHSIVIWSILWKIISLPKAQFLIQSTFGPTLASLKALSETSFQQWIDEQIMLPVESHREYWRKRTNPYVSSKLGLLTNTTKTLVESDFDQALLSVVLGMIADKNPKSRQDSHGYVWVLSAWSSPLPGRTSMTERWSGRHGQDVIQGHDGLASLSRDATSAKLSRCDSCDSNMSLKTVNRSHWYTIRNLAAWSLNGVSGVQQQDLRERGSPHRHWSSLWW